MRPGQCIHFHGVQHDTCRAGVKLVTIRDTSQRPFRWPCVELEDLGPATTTCAKYIEPTVQQLATQEAEIAAIVALMAARTSRGECCHCGTPMTSVRQVGMCIYAAPCGCRQGSGRAAEFEHAAGLVS